MKTINVSEATNMQLNWLVAKCEGFSYELYEQNRKKWAKGLYRPQHWSPTTNPAQMWPIIEREKIVICDWDYNSEIYAAELLKPYSKYAQGQGSTQLVAMARCYVTSKLGETVEVPEEL